VNPAAAALVLAAVASGRPPAAGKVVHEIAVDVRGPLAMVEVTRTLPSDSPASFDRLLDLALPEGAALVDVAVSDAGRWRDVAATADASKRYLASLDARGVSPSREPFDDVTTHRVRVVSSAAPSSPRQPATVRYRFSVLPPLVDGRRRVRFPATPERQPTPADVTVSVDRAAEIDLAGVRSQGGAARGRVSTRGAWELSWSQPRAAAPAAGVELDGSAAVAKVGPARTLAAVGVRAVAGQERQPPERVLLLVDRSRSVGLPGLSAERDLARRLLESLPPSTRFDALFFDRATHRLFPASRPATREALSALEAELVPDRLRNGTDLAGALREAGALLRREADAFAPRALVALITDGALPDGPNGHALGEALGAVPGVELTLAAWVIRPEGDDAAPASGRATLRQLAALHGGALRELGPRELGDEVSATLSALARGGDAADVRVSAGGKSRALLERLAPGEARARLLELEAPVRAVTATVGGRHVSVALRAQTVDAAWLRALEQPLSELGPRLVDVPGVVALVEVPHREAPAEDVVRGSLDRTVVRNTLSLAYSPRARACYLNRPAATPAERDLAGRVRIAIELARGEVGGVAIEASTLAAPRIEACLREGAFEIDVPRALRSDAPVTAVLNLVFRPRTPEKRISADEAALGAQIDLVIEGLHRDEAQSAIDPAPPQDRSMVPTR
jgi:hypothetical protein